MSAMGVFGAAVATTCRDIQTGDALHANEMEVLGARLRASAKQGGWIEMGMIAVLIFAILIGVDSTIPMMELRRQTRAVRVEAVRPSSRTTSCLTKVEFVSLGGTSQQKPSAIERCRTLAYIMMYLLSRQIPSIRRIIHAHVPIVLIVGSAYGTNMHWAEVAVVQLQFAGPRRMCACRRCPVVSCRCGSRIRTKEKKYGPLCVPSFSRTTAMVPPQFVVLWAMIEGSSIVYKTHEEVACWLGHVRRTKQSASVHNLLGSDAGIVPGIPCGAVFVIITQRFRIWKLSVLRRVGQPRTTYSRDA